MENEKELNDNVLEKVNGGTLDAENLNNNKEGPNMIIDNGTGYTKPGFQGEEGPRAIFPTIVGLPK